MLSPNLTKPFVVLEEKGNNGAKLVYSKDVLAGSGRPAGA